jgi:hypothetical protein
VVQQYHKTWSLSLLLQYGPLPHCPEVAVCKLVLALFYRPSSQSKDNIREHTYRFDGHKCVKKHNRCTCIFGN